MMTFRKLAVASTGKLIRAYFTEDRPAADTSAQPVQGAASDTGGRMTSYYVGDDLFRVLDGRKWPYDPAGPSRTMIVDLFVAPSGFGKSVLANTINLGLCLSSEAQGATGAKLPLIGKLDIDAYVDKHGTEGRRKPRERRRAPAAAPEPSPLVTPQQISMENPTAAAETEAETHP